MKSVYPKITALLIILSILGCRQKTTPSLSLGEHASGGQVNYIQSPLIDQFLKLKNAIIARNPELESEKNRSGKLFNLLMANTTLGCAANIVVRTVEFNIQGAPLTNVLVTKGNGNFTPALAQEMFTFGIGDQDFTHSLEKTSDELQLQSFGTTGSRIFHFPANTIKLGQLSRIRIRKLSPAYDIRDICKSGNADCPFQKSVTEIRRYGLYSLEVKVNGLSVYKQGNLGHAFATHTTSIEKDSIHATSMVFDDPYAALNETFVQAMSLGECSMYQ